MTEFTDQLELARGAFGASPVSMDAVHRLRATRRRNRRLSSAIVAIVVAALAFGAALKVLDRSLEQQPAHRLTPDNVKNLEATWTVGLDGEAAQVQLRALHIVATFPPTVADGRIYVATLNGTVYAFDASCAGDAMCDPLWIAEAPTAAGARAGSVSPIWNPPIVADGLVFVSAAGGHLLAYATDCATGGATCDPVWVADTGDAIDPPVISGGIVYGVDGRNGVVYAFSETCGTGGATCEPLWTAPTETYNQSAWATGGFIWRVAVSDGVVYAVGASENPDRIYAFDAATGVKLWWGRSAEAPRGGGGQTATTPIVANGLVLVSFQTIYAFPVGCRTDGGECTPAWTRPNAGAPVISGDTAYVNMFTDPANAGMLKAFPVDCGSGGAVCLPEWKAPTDTGFGDLAVADGMAFTTSTFGDVTLEAFPASCGPDGPACEAAWKTGSLGSPSFPPVVQDGVVYVATQNGHVYAFATNCGSGGATCEPLWEGAGTSPPAIEGTNLYTVSADGQVHAFALPAESSMSP